MSDGWIIDVIERARLSFHLGTVVEAVCVSARDLEGSVRLKLLDRAQDHLGGKSGDSGKRRRPRRRRHLQRSVKR